MNATYADQPHRPYILHFDPIDFFFGSNATNGKMMCSLVRCYCYGVVFACSNLNLIEFFSIGIVQIIDRNGSDAISGRQIYYLVIHMIQYELHLCPKRLAL